MKSNVIEELLFAAAKPLAIAIAALTLAQANPAMADPIQMSGLKDGKTRVLTNPTSIVINDTCADPEQAECQALHDYHNPVLPEPDPITGVKQVAPEVPVAKASPYISYIEVPDYAFKPGSKITDVNVTVSNIYHDYLNDLDILLVAPNGQWVMLASNVSSASGPAEGEPDDSTNLLGTKAEGLNWKFDDSATLPLPSSYNNEGRLSRRDTDPLYNVIYDEWVGVWTDTALRTFKPTDYDPTSDSDHFPDDAVPSTTRFSTSRRSAALTPTTILGPVVAEDQNTYKKVLNGPKLSSLNGISPTGQWRLVVVDDYYWFAGEIKGGWGLEITAKK